MKLYQCYFLGVSYVADLRYLLCNEVDGQRNLFILQCLGRPGLTWQDGTDYDSARAEAVRHDVPLQRVRQADHPGMALYLADCHVAWRDW